MFFYHNVLIAMSTVFICSFVAAPTVMLNISIFEKDPAMWRWTKCAIWFEFLCIFVSAVRNKTSNTLNALNANGTRQRVTTLILWVFLQMILWIFSHQQQSKDDSVPQVSAQRRSEFFIRCEVSEKRTQFSDVKFVNGRVIF